MLAIIPALGAADPFPPDLFGYRQTPRADISVFPQWVQALERHLIDDLREGDCDELRLNTCHMRDWTDFLGQIKQLPEREQIERVNRYANTRDYVLDLDNYGLIDYWAIPREFLFNGGDCEDYAITKLMSLHWLGYAANAIRIVVLQDTNLRIAHAVTAVGTGDDILILDNQVEEVLSHRQIVHYAPVYSVSESRWWMHLPGS
ncbi:MAG: transglutaminase-like cysteine peptidase [Gammaproteobacteria bacterium]